LGETVTYPPSQEPQKKDKINFSPGDSFGNRYRIIEEIGRGGMGRIYKAEDKELDITVALKMIRPEYSSNPRFIKWFKKETLLARSISHENVIRIHDLGEVDEIKYISMDYIKGQNLKELIHTSESLTIGTTVSITRQLCEALRVAHQKGIIHRDLKPQNIMIDNDGKPYVMDFGLAKSFEVKEDSMQGELVGTPQYMSPEQAKGEKADHRSDIYSLGIIIFEMLTGKQPFEAKTFAGYIHKHIHEKTPPPSEINPLIPHSLEKIILKCLEKDKEKRYQNVEELLEYLDEHKEITRPLLPRTGIKKWAAVISAVSLIFLLALVIILWRGRKEPEIPPLSGRARISVAVMYFENNTGEESLEHWRRAFQEYLITDLAQSKYLRVLPDDRLLQILEKMNQDETIHYSSEVLEKIASEENIKYFILGGYGKAGDDYRITVKIKEARAREFMDTEIVEGKGEESFHSIVDQITPWIKSNFDLTPYEIASDIDKEIGQITSSSPEALKFYIEGKTYFSGRKFEESIETLKKAVVIDPEFAMAYNLLAANYEYSGYPDKQKEYLQKALALLDRVSLRERYFIEGESYVRDNMPQKAIENFQKLLELYPDDIEGVGELASKYRIIEEWDLAMEQFKRLIKADPQTAYDNIPYILMAKGEHEKAREILEVNQHVLSNQPFFHRYMCYVFFCQGKYDLALLEAREALSLEPDFYFNTLLIGNIHHIKGDFPKAEDSYRKIREMNEPIPQSDGRYWMGHLYLSQGKYKKCQAEINEGIARSQKFDRKDDESRFMLFLAYLNLQLNRLAEAIDASNQAMKIALETGSADDQKIALHFRGLAHLKMKKTNEAKNTAEQLKQLIEKTGYKKQMRHYYHLMGMIVRERNLIPQSIEHFKRALSLLPHQKYVYDEQAFYLDALASTFYKSGDLENAYDYYEKIISLTTGRLRWGDIYAISYYMLGRIYQEKGWIGKAIDQYETFLDLWNDADPGVLEKEDAKKQSAFLRKVSQE